MKILDQASLSIQNGRASNDDRAMSVILDRVGEAADTTALFAVFDGMGGNNQYNREAGRVSSRFAEQSISKVLIPTLAELHYQAEPVSEKAMHNALAGVLTLSDQNLHARGSGFGTTASLAVVVGGMLYCANTGDSPICLIRHQSGDGTADVLRLYEQQNNAGFGMPDGWPDEAEFARQTRVGSSHVLRQFIGGGNVQNIPFFSEKLCQGDILLLGSDGGLAHFTRQELIDTVDSALDMQNLTVTLRKKAAVEKHENDNLTLIAVQFGA
ncbi:MAG: PP2C family protein-serine/threonine phosphatase [Oscillospiraceae bacterium]|jgi:serine/threonine protein phosphatase PrpC